MKRSVNSPITWSRFGGYECSTQGDRRFSAITARLDDGRTIEEHYQCDVKGYDPNGTNWRLGKGKPPLDPTKDLFNEYLKLWWRWAHQNEVWIEELRDHAVAHNHRLSDRFATTPVNQAHALAVILTKIYYDIT